MNILRSIVMAFSLYSTVPMPNIKWEKENMKLTMAVFHLVGLLIFAFTLIIYFLGVSFSISPFLFSILIILTSFFTTGGIHKDGFMDSCDGFFSRKEKEKALEIMSDSSCGAFAVIGLMLLLLTNFVSLSLIFQNNKFILPLGSVFVFSRLLSGYCVLTIPKAKKDGMLSPLLPSDKAKKTSLLIIYAVFAFWAVFVLSFDFLGGLAILLVFAISYFVFKKKILSRFGGITGDLAGFLLEMSQSASFLALAVLGEVLK